MEKKNHEILAFFCISYSTILAVVKNGVNNTSLGIIVHNGARTVKTWSKLTDSDLRLFLNGTDEVVNTLLDLPTFISNFSLLFLSGRLLDLCKGEKSEQFNILTKTAGSSIRAVGNVKSIYAIAPQILATIKAKPSPSKGHELLLGPAYFQTFLRSGSPYASWRFKILVEKAVYDEIVFDGTDF